MDKELGQRGLHFVRYADDCNIYVRSKRAGLRVMENITQFIEKKLKLKVNEQKSASVETQVPWIFFHHPQGEPKDTVSKKSIKRFKQRIRELISGKQSMNMERRIEQLNRYLVGWLGYYQLAENSSIFKMLDSWIRRRLRMIKWKEWKKVKRKYKNLMKYGVSRGKAWEWANTRKGYWRIASSPILHRTLGDQYWINQGLKVYLKDIKQHVGLK